MASHPETATAMQRIGSCLKTNGEAIYDTRPWKIAAVGPTVIKESKGFLKNLKYTSKDIRYTMNKDGKHVYAIVLAKPEATVFLNGISDQVEMVEMLGANKPVHWVQDSGQIKIQFPSDVVDQPAYGFKVRLQ